MDTVEANKAEAPNKKAEAPSILTHLDFMEALVNVADADGLVASLEPDNPSYARAARERAYRVQALAEVVDAYCERRVSEALAAQSSMTDGDSRRGVLP